MLKPAKTWPILLITVALTACATTEVSKRAVEARPIVLDVRKTPIEGGIGCEIEIFASYSSDMQRQTRELNISDTSSEFVRSLATVELPRPEDDPRPVVNDDGTTSFRVFQWSFSRCRDVPLKFEIGECVEGTCPQMIVAPEMPDGVTIDIETVSSQT